MDAAVLTFTALVATVTALMFGLVPALRVSSVPLAQIARSRGRNVSARTSGGRMLVVLQVALAVVLVVGAGLLLSSFARLRAVDPGFDTSNLVVARVALPGRAYPDGESRRRFFRHLLDRLQSAGGIETAAAATRVPLRSQGPNMTFTVDTAPAKDLNGVVVQEMSPELIDALRLRVIYGRALEERDSEHHTVALVSRSFARRTWGTDDVVGRRVRMGPTYISEGMAWLEVVGVVEDVRQYQLATTGGPQVYLPYGQTDGWPPTEIVVRSALAPTAVVNALRSAVRELDPNQPVTAVYTMRDVLQQSVARPRFNAILIGVFAAIALVLAVVGIYGVISYAVTERTREIGVRVALGARRVDVLRLVGSEGMTAVCVGLVVGLIVSALLTRLLEGLLFEIKPLDPATYAVAAIVMLLAAAAACVLPTLRATRVDPAEALRAQ
jgi:putative ABC transport system permease protein